jgi:hypothetical protein
MEIEINTNLTCKATSVKYPARLFISTENIVLKNGKFKNKSKYFRLEIEQNEDGSINVLVEAFKDISINRRKITELLEK